MKLGIYRYSINYVGVYVIKCKGKVRYKAEKSMEMKYMKAPEVFEST